MKILVKIAKRWGSRLPASGPQFLKIAF